MARKINENEFDVKILSDSSTQIVNFEALENKLITIGASTLHLYEDDCLARKFDLSMLLGPGQIATCLISPASTVNLLYQQKEASLVTFLLAAGKMTVTPVGTSIRHNCSIKRTSLGLILIIDASIFLVRGMAVESVYAAKSNDRSIVGVDEIAPGKWLVAFSDMSTEVIGEAQKVCTQELPLSQPYLLKTMPLLRIDGLNMQLWVF